MDVPKKLSKAITIAIKDVNRAKEDKKMFVDMDDAWHRQMNDGICHVCFAGAVMHYEFDLGYEQLSVPHQFNHGAWPQQIAWSDYLYALDDVRKGHIDDALEAVGQDLPEGVDTFDCDVPEFKHDPNGFNAAMGELVIELEKHNL